MTPPTRAGSMSGQTPTAGVDNKDNGNTEMFSGQSSGADITFGLDTSEWFDISSFSYDADALLAIIPEGAMFEAATDFKFGS